VTITENGFNQLILGSKKIIQMQPATRKAFLADMGGQFGDFAIRDAHVISGRTRDSLHVSAFTDTYIEFQAMWGAKWEEKRGGTHAFMTHALNHVKQNATQTANKYYSNLIKSNIGVGGRGPSGPPRATTYISKYMKNGRWVYKYK